MSGFNIAGLRSQVTDLGFRVSRSWFRVPGSGSQVFGCRVRRTSGLLRSHLLGRDSFTRILQRARGSCQRQRLGVVVARCRHCLAEVPGEVPAIREMDYLKDTDLL